MNNLAGTGQTDIFVDEMNVPPAKEISSLSSDRDHLCFFAGVLLYKGLSRFDDVGVKCTGQSFIGADKNDQVFFITTLIEQRMRDLARDLSTEPTKHLGHLAGKRTRSRHAILRAFELRRSDHLHRLGDLLCILDRLDPPAHV